MQQRHFVATSCVRTDRWKLCYYPLEQTGMLFDLQEDPQEHVNRFADTGCRDVRLEMMQLMVERLHTSKDPLPIRLTDA